MLARLLVRNYAIVRWLEVDLRSGLTIITGETGAGKSIIVDALALALGERADTSVIGPEGDRCIVEAEFVQTGPAVQDSLVAIGVDVQSTVILRRELMRDGRTRAFVNDTPVRLADLRTVGSLLVDIHSQHAALQLREHDFLLNLVDVAAGTVAQAKQHRQLFTVWEKALNRVHQAEEAAAKDMAERDYLQFQFDELEALRPKAEELDALIAELSMAEHADEARQAATAICTLLADGDESAEQRLAQAITLLGQSGRHLPGADELRNRLRTVHVELRDVAATVAEAMATTEVDPERAEMVRQRVDSIQRLLVKHRLRTDTELVHLHSALGSKLAAIETGAGDLTELRNEADRCRKELLQLSAQLSNARIGVINRLSDTITQGLHYLGMPSAQVQVTIDVHEVPAPSGIDRVRMLFSANKGMQLADASKVASGGELSRLILVIKGHLAQEAELPTIVLDEVDTGVSGETAGRIGQSIAALARTMQVLCITHLPQVAARADAHLHVSKTEDERGTNTLITDLNKEDRTRELARMLSAGEPTAAALANAAQLMAGSAAE
jgi:DNA repair protein RecN (Recombination protein N)